MVADATSRRHQERGRDPDALTAAGFEAMRAALMDHFGGAIDSCATPHAHQNVAMTAAEEPIEIVVPAGHPPRIVDACRSRRPVARVGFAYGNDNPPRDPDRHQRGGRRACDRRGRRRSPPGGAHRGRRPVHPYRRPRLHFDHGATDRVAPAVVECSPGSHRHRSTAPTPSLADFNPSLLRRKLFFALCVGSVRRRAVGRRLPSGPQSARAVAPADEPATPPSSRACLRLRQAFKGSCG